ADRFEPLAITTDTLGLVMATPLRAPGPILRLEWRRTLLTTPWPDPWHTPAPAFPARLALADPVSTARRGPRVGQSQKGEGPLAPCRGGSVGRPLARTPPRLGGRHGQAKALQTLRQDVHDPVGVRCARAAEAQILGQTRHTAPARPPGLHPLATPCVQAIMQAYAGSYG